MDRDKIVVLNTMWSYDQELPRTVLVLGATKDVVAEAVNLLDMEDVRVKDIPEELYKRGFDVVLEPNILDMDVWNGLSGYDFDMEEE